MDISDLEQVPFVIRKGSDGKPDKKPLVATRAGTKKNADAVRLDHRYLVLDVDVDGPSHPGAAGDEDLFCLEQAYEPLPACPTVLTPSGGRHCWFRLPEAFTGVLPGKLGDDIDIRKAGGLLVVPPTPGYEWELGSPDEAPATPEWLLNHLIEISNRRHLDECDVSPVIAVPDWIQACLHDRPRARRRSHQVFDFVKACRRAGMGLQQTIDVTKLYPPAMDKATKGYKIEADVQRIWPKVAPVASTHEWIFEDINQFHVDAANARLVHAHELFADRTQRERLLKVIAALNDLDIRRKVRPLHVSERDLAERAGVDRSTLRSYIEHELLVPIVHMTKDPQGECLWWLVEYDQRTLSQWASAGPLPSLRGLSHSGGTLSQKAPTDPDKRSLLNLDHSQVAQEVLHALDDHGLTVKQLVEATGLPQRTVERTLRYLADKELATRHDGHRQGRGRPPASWNRTGRPFDAQDYSRLTRQQAAHQRDRERRNGPNLDGLTDAEAVDAFIHRRRAA